MIETKWCRRTAGASVLVLAFVLDASAQQTTAQAKAEVEGIPHYKRLSAELAVGGQPSDEALEKLRELGFKAILNLRTPREGSEEERKKAEALGLDYYNIPITPDTITEEKVQEFSRILREAEKPLLVHCASSNRVGGLWYIHRALDDGLPEDKALEEAKQAGLRSPTLEQIVREFVRKKKSEGR